MNSMVRLALRSLSGLVLMTVICTAGWVGAQDGGAATPTPMSGLGGLFAKTPAPTGNSLDATGVPVVFESYQITFPQDWLTWTLDRQAKESANEQALIELVALVNTALAAAAEGDIRDLIPPMIMAGVAPETPGGELIYITVLEYGYRASLSDLQLPATTTPELFLATLGFPLVEDRQDLTAGFLVEEAGGVATVYGGFVSTDLDRLMLVTAVCDSASWGAYVPTITEIVGSFALSDQDAQPAAATVKTPVPTAAITGLTPGTYNTAELPVLTPINILYQQPYQFSFPVITTGAVDLAALDFDPTLEKIEGTDYYPPVTGFVSAEPVGAFYATPYTNVGVVFAGNYYADTVLLVRRPDGHWHFADDVKYANPDPAIATNSGLEGVYEVWIGTKLPNQSVSGELYVIVE